MLNVFNWLILVLYTEDIQLRCSSRWSMFQPLRRRASFNKKVFCKTGNEKHSDDCKIRILTSANDQLFRDIDSAKNLYLVSTPMWSCLHSLEKKINGPSRFGICQCTHLFVDFLGTQILECWSTRSSVSHQHIVGKNLCS